MDIEGGDTGAGRIKTTDQCIPTLAYNGTTVAVSVVVVIHRTLHKRHYSLSLAEGALLSTTFLLHC